MSFTFSAGTEEIGIAVLAEGKASTNIVTSHKHHSTGNNGENTGEGVDDETLEYIDTDEYTNSSSSEWSSNFSLGGDDGYQNESSLSFEVNVSSFQDQKDIFNGEEAGYSWHHAYIDYSDDQLDENPDLPERQNIKTAIFYDLAGEYEAEEPVIGDVSGITGAPEHIYDDASKTPEEILADYQAHKEQLLRLQALLAITDDPSVKQMLEDQIAMQDEILAGITAAATDAGITTGQLQGIDDAVQAAIDADPPTWSSGEGSNFFDGSWFDFGAFGSTFGGEVGAIGDGFAGMYYSVIGDTMSANAAFSNAYASGPPGITADSGGIYYWGTRGALGAASTAMAGAIIAMGGELAIFGRSAFVNATRGQSALLVEGNPWMLIRHGYSGARGIVQIRPSGSAPLIRLDFHAITEGGRRLLHLDFNRWGISHWPW